MPYGLPVSVVVPTFGREDVLIDTIRQILRQNPPASEVLIVDQTPAHEPATEKQLDHWNSEGSVKWRQLGQPSQPAALNYALREATQPIVVFLDDDICLCDGFVGAHARHYSDPHIWGVAGQILQPGQTATAEWLERDENSPFADFEFPANYSRRRFVKNALSGNCSVRREKAITIGGMDENFLPPVAYRFDNDFFARLVAAGGRVVFEPEASLRHLRSGRGGTRSKGSHLTSASPIHGVGYYYFCFKHGKGLRMLRYLLKRPFREVRTKFHLTHPWWVLPKLLGEFRAIWQAYALNKRGPQYLELQHAQR